MQTNVSYKMTGCGNAFLQITYRT